MRKTLMLAIATLVAIPFYASFPTTKAEAGPCYGNQFCRQLRQENRQLRRQNNQQQFFVQPLQPRWVTQCSDQPLYDQWGNFAGSRRACTQVQVW